MELSFSSLFKKYNIDIFRTVYRNQSIHAFIVWCFLKYCLDLKMCNNTPESLSNYADLLADFYNSRIDASKVEKMFIDVEAKYSLNGSLSRAASFFREETSFIKDIIKVVSQFDFKNDLETLLPGIRALINFLVPRWSGRNTMGLTNLNVSRIASSILNVQPDDLFVDFCSGTGLSTLEVVDDSNTQVVLADINPDARTLSAMVLIMFQYKNFEIRSFYDLENNIKVSKLFSDLPIIINNFDPDGTVSMGNHANFLFKAKKMLKDDGVAVLTVPGKYLFSASDSIRYSRDVLIKEKYLDAVITLPFTYEGTTVKTNLIVLKKNSEKPLFIDASKITANDEGMDAILEIYSNRQEINGLSKCLTGEQILKEGTSFSPARYTIKEEYFDIDEELNKTETKLKEAIAHLRGLIK